MSSTIVDYQNYQSLKLQDLEAVKKRMDQWKRESDTALDKLLLFLEVNQKRNMKEMIEKKGLPIEIFYSENEDIALIKFLSNYARMKSSCLLEKGTVVFSWFNMTMEKGVMI